MKKFIHVFALLLLVVSIGTAQTTILDFEDAATSTTFQHFGSSLEPMLTPVIANPDASGINTSSMVLELTKPADALDFAGVFSNPNPATAVDCAAHGKMTVKVWMDHIGTVTLKFEEAVGGGDNWAQTRPNTLINQWEEIEFDFSEPSFETPNNTATGTTYAKIVLFIDLGTVGGATDVVTYVDDMVAQPGPAPMDTEILNFENLSSIFQYFGSDLEGQKNQIIANPNPTATNMSAMVAEYVKPGVAMTWAGAFSDSTLMPFDVTSSGQVCVDVHMDHIGNLAVKLENNPAGDPNWIQLVENTVVNDWEQLCFDLTLPSLEAPFEPATGEYETLVVFFDFNQEGTGSDVTSYFDNVVLKPSTGPQVRTVNFAVDMNNYTQNFDNVYVSGSFNNWSGDANPLTDDNFDGIWEGSVTTGVGAHEYKITLDNWAAQEEFAGTEECTVSDPSGNYVNRRLLVTGDMDVPVHCFNSCYECGQERTITFRLGMGSVVPSADGVWLSGGGNFDVPGGRYAMNDNDMDGVWEIVVPRAAGFASYYAFANGACPDFSCKESLMGLPCGDPNNFDDRWLPAIVNDTIIETCFGACFTNAECTSGASSLQKDATLFSLMGNPVANNALLTFGNEQHDAIQITLSNTLGQVVHQVQLDGAVQQYTVPTSALQSGLYYITVQSGTRFFTEKIIKQ